MASNTSHCQRAKPACSLEEKVEITVVSKRAVSWTLVHQLKPWSQHIYKCKYNYRYKYRDKHKYKQVWSSAQSAGLHSTGWRLGVNIQYVQSLLSSQNNYRTTAVLRPQIEINKLPSAALIILKWFGASLVAPCHGVGMSEKWKSVGTKLVVSIPPGHWLCDPGRCSRAGNVNEVKKVWVKL